MRMSTATVTPAMRQYLEAKRQFRDAIVFFRMGDFYEMFYEDALVASRALELTLTSRSKDAGGAGIPINGVNVIFANGYPNNASIDLLLQSYEGYTPNAAGNRMVKNGATTANCWVQYNQPAAAGAAPTISYQAGTITTAATETTVNNALRTQC